VEPDATSIRFLQRATVRDTGLQYMNVNAGPIDSNVVIYSHNLCRIHRLELSAK
jgi:hypothetical protein